jgi:hypothetical protein
VDDDGLEMIDLTPESDGDEAPPRRTVRLSRRQAIVLGVGVGFLAAAGGLFAQHRSAHKAAFTVPTTPSSVAQRAFTIPPTTWVPPAGISGLASGRSVAVLLGTPLVVSDSGRVQKILDDIPGDASVDVAQRGAALVHFKEGARVIVGPTFDGTRNALPSPIELLPDAEGRWWSNFGELQSSTELHEIRFPAGTTPVAKLRRGYLLVDDAHTGLFEWQSRTPPVRIGGGDVRVLAIAGELFAWTDDVGSTVHITDLETGRAVTTHTPFSAVTARFSPDRSRLAILSGGLSESMVLADPASGRVIAQLVTASGGNALTVFDDVPPAFQPVPFSWDSTGRLVVIAQTTVGYFVHTVDPVSGSVLRTVAAPEGLQQLISLAP